MWFLLCVILALWCSNVSAKPVQADGCCMPETWEAVSSVFLHLHPIFIQQRNTYSVDFKNSRYAQNTTAYIGTELIYELFLMFKNVSYIVDLGAKSCIKYSDGLELERCLPSDFTHVGPSKIGGVLDIDTYIDSSATSEIEVTHDDCLFVSQSVFDPDNDTYGSFRYYNVTTTIADNSAFDIPSYCEEAQVVEDIRMLPAFRRFKSFFLK